MEREPHYRFCKKSLISGKRINRVPVFGVSRNKTLLVDSGQDSVVLAEAFESLRFPFEQGESFFHLLMYAACYFGLILQAAAMSQLGMRKVQILS